MLESVAANAGDATGAQGSPGPAVQHEAAPLKL